MPALRLLILGAIALLLGACASQPAAELQVPAGQYTTAFEAAKETLRGFDFSLETHRRLLGRDLHQTQDHRGRGNALGPRAIHTGSGGRRPPQPPIARGTRHVRARGGRPAQRGWRRAPRNLRESSPPVVMRVTVQVSRRQKPGWRLETSAIRTSTRTSDPELLRAGMEPGYETPTGDDPKLAGRIAQEIAERLAAGPAMDQRTSAERRGDEAAASSSPSPSSAPAAASATSGPR